MSEDRNGLIGVQQITKSVVPTAIEIIPKKNKQDNNKWITAEILDLMQERREIVNMESTENRAIGKQIQKTCEQEKETWKMGNVKKLNDLRRKNSSNTQENQITLKQGMLILWLHKIERRHPHNGERRHIKAVVRIY